MDTYLVLIKNGDEIKEEVIEAIRAYVGTHNGCLYLDIKDGNGVASIVFSPGRWQEIRPSIEKAINEST